MTAATIVRYVTADFKNAPLHALADLMGLGQYKEQIGSSPDLYTPISDDDSIGSCCLCGYGTYL